MAYFTSYFKAYFNVGTVAPPVTQGGGSLPSRKSVKRAKDWLRRKIEREIAKAFPQEVKREIRVTEINPLPEPRKTLRLGTQRTERFLDLEKLLKRQEQKKQVLAVVDSKVEEDLLKLFEVERAKRKAERIRKAKRVRDEIFLLLHL